MKPKFILAALFAALTISVLPSCQKASGDTPKPTPSTEFSGGKGTQADPFIISGESDLRLLSQKCNEEGVKASFYLAAHYRQLADIEMSSTAFVPVAAKAVFSGTYDGNGKSITGLKIVVENHSCGFVAHAKGAILKGINLKNLNMDSQYQNTGAICGWAEGGTVISGCYVSGLVRNYTTGLTDKVAPNNEGVANVAVSGGLVGRLEDSTIDNCTFDGNASFYGKFAGGIAGFCSNSQIKNTHVLKDRIINIYYHYCGGFVGRMIGAGSLIEGCSFEGSLNSCGYNCGGFVGQLAGGTIRSCVFGSYGFVGTDKYFVGGIAGSSQPLEDVLIEKCVCYGSVSGAYSVGGIVGYSGAGAGASSDKAMMIGANKSTTIKECASCGAHINATNGNSNKYPIAGGILGWSHTGVALHINGCYSIPGVIETINGENVNGVLCGICAYQNTLSGATIENCYSAYSPTDMLVCNDPISNNTSNWYAAIHIRCTQATTVKNCFSLKALRIGYSSSAATETGCNQFTDAEMVNGTLLGALKSSANGASWVAGTNGFPTISGLPADPNVKPKAKKRISVIGDSISTFRGWIPGTFAAHYPATDGTLTLVNETYWYRLAHDYMSSAVIDLNIAFSGSTVTNTTQENFDAYVKRTGDSSNTWFKHSFTERFAFCGGCGKPDIILIHGGTNDWAHNADPLAPGLKVRNDTSNDYGGQAPSKTVMDGIFQKADAATTRAAINALPDGTYCEAYTKLLRQIQERYPKCKVVCIIGDYLSQSIELSTIQIAEHYGARVVNLFRVNGFNDLGGYSPTTLKNKGVQPNMPKHDYPKDAKMISGCHPASKGMQFIAEKIYNELGAWLEE